MIESAPFPYICSVKAEIIDKYFSTKDKKRLRFTALESLYLYWNERINVISRKDTEHLYERHILHSLGIAKVTDFAPGTRVLDIGTGGGFPGIPLAIMFPQTEFVLTDSIGKKIKVVQAVADELKLDNVTAIHTRAEKVNEGFDFAVSRAVTDLKKQWVWIRTKIRKKGDCKLSNGFLALKGGDLTEELKSSGLKTNVYDLRAYFDEEFFKTKSVVHVSRKHN